MLRANADAASAKGSCLTVVDSGGIPKRGWGRIRRGPAAGAATKWNAGQIVEGTGETLQVVGVEQQLSERPLMC
jgi:hypothetical protein